MEINWLYNNTVFTEQDIGENYGFIYIITNLSNNRKYIGKKFFYSMKSKVIKGKRKKYKIISDWESYYGSNTELQNDVKTLGETNFKREIIHLCKTKGECGYLEAKEQFDRCVLETQDYYNNWIMVRVRKTHIKAYNDRIMANIKN